MRVGRNVLGGVSLVTFFAQAKKVTRSPAGRVEALLLKHKITKEKSLDSRQEHAGMTSEEQEQPTFQTLKESQQRNGSKPSEKHPSHLPKTFP
ncbi:hypothetical protein, partial [Puniceibacterium confluentis]|uniref:hypothetical protein n=1 Tax=Puniceibacterium confluentis TaxID=1958944 RepID=UPI001C9478B8